MDERRLFRELIHLEALESQHLSKYVGAKRIERLTKNDDDCQFSTKQLPLTETKPKTNKFQKNKASFRRIPTLPQHVYFRKPFVRTPHFELHGRNSNRDKQ